MNIKTLENGKQLARLIEQVREAQHVLELLPCGGIGPDGATQEDLDDAAEDGGYIENDAMVDLGQRCWRMLDRVIKDAEDDDVQGT